MTDQPTEVWILIAGVVFLTYAVFYLAGQLRSLRQTNKGLRKVVKAYEGYQTDQVNDVHLIDGFHEWGDALPARDINL